MAKARIALVGCGTLGGAYAINLVRMGMASLRLIDRDIVEEHNLSTQLLFDEEDARQVLPKAVAAQRHLQRINSSCRIEACTSDLTSANAGQLLSSVDLIMDATDNFETRFLINDAAIELGVPWIYSGVVGFAGVMMAIIPGKTACLRCFMDSPPDSSSLPTCETAGVWPPAAQAVVALALTEALRLLTGKQPQIGLSELDLESNQWRKISVQRKPDCPACARHELSYLEGKIGAQATKMCGRDMVHLTPQRELKLDLTALAGNLRSIGEVRLTEFLLQFKAPEAEIYLFSDGRAFVKGLTDSGRARAVFNRYVTT